jgi:hypothetical protein
MMTTFAGIKRKNIHDRFGNSEKLKTLLIRIEIALRDGSAFFEIATRRFIGSHSLNAKAGC